MSSANWSTEQLESLFNSLNQKDLSDIKNFEDRPSRNIPAMSSTSIECISNRFLSLSNTLDWNLLDELQSVPDLDFMEGRTGTGYDYASFANAPDPISRTSYHFQRLGIEGKISGYKELVNLEEIENANASNSLSITRKIDHRGNMIKGSTNQLPFTPGGLVDEAVDENVNVDNAKAEYTMKLLNRDQFGLFNIPPGMERGIIPFSEMESSTEDYYKDFENLNQINNSKENRIELETRFNEEHEKLVSNPIIDESQDIEEIDSLLPVGINFGRTLRKFDSAIENKEWAHVVDLNSKIDNFDELVPNPARTWPFELDGFQKEAVYHLEQGDSVFVAAHTSAGKTVVAEYAIAMSNRNMTKTIYTSPIKALSNQKFRDFKEDFKDVDVGLITGDVQINPEANCLIMTTEILRSMLYRGADLIRDVEFVIFDEVHYVNDQSRGVVWEEVIIMLPQHVKFILLSATVPNTFEFASWVGRTKQKNMYVISTPKRPIPLEINVWAKGKIIPIINEQREFLSNNFKMQKDLYLKKENDSQGSKPKTSTNKQNSQGNQKSKLMTRGSRGVGAVGSNAASFYRNNGPSKKTWSDLVNKLKNEDLLPAVIFVFSKKRCEDYADWLQGIDFLNAKEKSLIHMFIEKSISRLRKDDRELPQIAKVRSLLSRGIAVHHGGLLPIVKELIEILFSKGLVRVLFATETFAMGLNLPTRTVIFSEISKHDGESKRLLNPGEFTQMAGRAGRRGKDKKGTVIVMTYQAPIEEMSFKEVALGVPTRLQSQFRLTYNMILNLLRIEALRVEEMIKFSFSENSKQTLKPEQEEKICQLQKQIDVITANEIGTESSKDMDRILELTLRYRNTCRDIIKEIDESKSLTRVFSRGRFIIFRNSDDQIMYGLLFRISPLEGTCTVLALHAPLVLSNGKTNHLPAILFFKEFIEKNYVRKCFPNDFLKLEMFEIPIFSIEEFTNLSFRASMVDVLNDPDEGEKSIQGFLRSLRMESRKDGFEISVIKKGSLKLHQLALDRKKTLGELMSFTSSQNSGFVEVFEPYYRKHLLEREMKEIYHLMSEQNLNLLPDYEQRLSVLRESNFIDQNNNVLLKGRVACEINTGYELVLTELILDNFLGEFEPEEIVALLSVFVYEGRTREEEPTIMTPRLVKGKKRIEDIYSKMLQIYEKYQVPLTQEEAEFLDKKRFALLNVVYEWARGLSFKEIMDMSVEAEGTIVRVISRLDEVCREVRNAAVIIGNSSLHHKMTHAQELIKRDIVFAASLYL